MAQRADVVDLSGYRDPEAIIQISLLGPLVVERAGEQLDVTGPKRRALLTLLALDPGSPIGRDRIVESLWPERPTGREESTLRVHVSHIRDRIEPDRDGEPIVLLTSGSAYLLASETVRVDIEQFERLRRTGRSLLEDDPQAALANLNRALALWRGRPLQDVEYEEFAQEAIRHLDAARTETIEDRAEALVGLGDDAAAIEDLEGLVRDLPARERPVLLLMRALYRMGRQSDAMRVARRHRRRLAEMGLEPSPRLALLEDQVLNHDPSLLPAGAPGRGDVRPGRSVRGYELRAEAGSGELGVVFRAFQPSVGREVALKSIRPDLSRDPEFVRKFAEEARVIAGLEHPHIVPLYDFWRDPSGAFLVMRWMDGGSLSDRLDRDWNDDEAARVITQVAEALGYAHSAGVVHRDIKPANVLFDAADNAYLCDFGLAVAGVETGRDGLSHRSTLESPYAAPELNRGEGPTVASDVFALGVMLGEVTGDGSESRRRGTSLGEVVDVATASNPADRYPDMAAFVSALREVSRPMSASAPPRVRRNPYKGLEPFDEGDRADFYGREDVVETLVDAVGGNGLTALAGASGSGKSSVVRAGLVPELRQGALPGSDEWSIIHMVPGIDPYEEFQIGLRDVAIGYDRSTSDGELNELRAGLSAALDGPNSRAVLIIDQFEELFSSEIDEATRQRFLDDLSDLGTDPSRRARVVVTLRADFSDRPLAHPRFGELMSRSTVLLTAMRPEQVEDAIRRPASRVGVQVEPGLISEIVRDVAASSAFLPHLQYVLAELFERRTEDRLTVQAYRSLGGVQGVLERRAETTFSSLNRAEQTASRQLFLRMVHLGDHGVETRRRLPVTELDGLGGRAEVEAALEAFSASRLIVYDRDPVSRTPTVEVAHETVIARWTRFRVWIDEARGDLHAHRRLSTAASTWADSGEDPAYLLTGGPLASAIDVADGERVRLNELEARFVEESRIAEEAARRADEDRRRHEEMLERRSRRRLASGVTAGLVALLVGVLAAFAVVQRQRADELAEAQSRENVARELAVASMANLDSADPDLSLLLAIRAADLSLDVGAEVLPEVVEALHRALIHPRPELIVEGAGNSLGGQVIDYSSDGAALAALSADGGIFVIDPSTGEDLGGVDPVETPALGIAFHPDGEHILSIHHDAVREWNWHSGRMTRQFLPPKGVGVTTAVYARNGSNVAVGGDDGVVRVYVRISSRLVAQLKGHRGEVATIDFDPTGRSIVSGGGVAENVEVIVWDIGSEEVAARAKHETLITSINHVAWHPFAPLAVVATSQGEIFQFNTVTGDRDASFGNGQSHSRSVAYDPSGSFVLAAGTDGFARAFPVWVGGEAALEYPTGGLPLRDAAFDPSEPLGTASATVGVDGKVRIWKDQVGSELPHRTRPDLYQGIAGTPDGSRYVTSANVLWPSALVRGGRAPRMEVVDADSGEVLLTRDALYEVNQRRPAITDDGSVVAYPAPSGNVALANVQTGAVNELADSSVWNVYLDFTDDGELLAGAALRDSIGVWDVKTKRRLVTLRGHGDHAPAHESDPGARSRIDEIAFRPGYVELYSAGYDGTVRVWDLETGASRVLRSFEYEVLSLAFSQDGSRLAVAERSGHVAVVHPSSGQSLLELEAVSGPPELTFSPDGSLLVGAGPGPVVHIWDTGTGLLQRRLYGAIYPATGVVFVNGGEALRVVSGEGVERGYLLHPTAMVELAQDQVSRDLTEDECQRYLGHTCEQ